MAKAEKSGGDDEAKGVVATFLKTVGVVDIFLGGMTLYLISAARPGLFSPFKRTGLDFADNALLVCAAALTGKLVNVLACLAAGGFGARKRYKRDLAKVRDASLPKAQRLVDLDIYDSAVADLENRAPEVASRVLMIRDNAVLTYGSALVLIGFGLLWTPPERVPRLMIPGAGLALLFVAWLVFNDFVRTLALALERQVQRAPGASDPGTN